MTVFGNSFIFLDNPNGGVENLSEMRAAGFSGVFCNIRDYAPSQWEKIVRPRAKSLGMFCGVWARTAKLDSTGKQIEPVKFDPAIIEHLLVVADRWESPMIINVEKEIDGSNAAITSFIADRVGTRDAALSTEAFLFYDVDWRPVSNMPVLLQIFPVESASSKDPEGCRKRAYDAGIKCVYFTFGTFRGQEPTQYNLKSPYSLFTGDAMGTRYMRWSPTSSGYVACKPVPTGGSRMVLKPLTTEQVPYTGPYGLATGKFRSKGPTAEAVKRAMGHLKYMPWQDYDQHWNLPLWEAFADWKVSVKLPHDGSYGEQAWIKLRAATYKKNGKTLYALDPYARWLIQNEAGRTAQSSAEEKVQAALSEWGRVIIANEPNIGYSQARPFRVNVDPSSKFDSDCSATVVQGFAYAKRKTDLSVPDPAKQRYTGYGNTDWYEDDHPKVGGPYRIGDLAHFHSSRHVMMCIKPGDYKGAEWVSHGREAGPELVTLAKYNRYPSEFMFVVRPPLLEV